LRRIAQTEPPGALLFLHVAQIDELAPRRNARKIIAMGFFVGHVFPEFVENSVGEKEIAEYKLVGTE